MDSKEFIDKLEKCRNNKERGERALEERVEHGARVENYCRDFLPNNGLIPRKVLDLLCRLNRIEYVKELWDHCGDKKARFHHDCIREIGMLDDYEFFVSVYEYFDFRITQDVAEQAIDNAADCDRWKNAFYLLDMYPKALLSRKFIESRSGDGFYSSWKIKIRLRHVMDLCRQVAFAGKDKKAVLELVRKEKKGFLLGFADETLQYDREVVMVAVREGGRQYIPYFFRKDKELVIETVKQYGFFLRHVDDSLRKDKDVVMAAVKQVGQALCYADDSLQKDKEIVMAAVNKDRFAMELVDKSLLKDKEFMLEVVKQDGLALQFVDESLRKDKEIFKASVNENRIAMKYADKSLLEDKVFMLEIVKQDGLTLQFVDESLRKDKEIVMEAVKQDEAAIQFADKSLRRGIRAFLRSR